MVVTMLAEVPLDPARLCRLPPLRATMVPFGVTAVMDRVGGSEGSFKVVGDLGEMLRLLEQQGALSASGHGCGKKCYHGKDSGSGGGLDPDGYSLPYRPDSYMPGGA